MTTSALTFGFAGSCTGFFLAVLTAAVLVPEAVRREAVLAAAALFWEAVLAVLLFLPVPELFVPDPEEEVFRFFGAAALAEAFFVVFGLLFCVGFLEAFLVEEDVPLCAILNLSLSDHPYSR